VFSIAWIERVLLTPCRKRVTTRMLIESAAARTKSLKKKERTHVSKSENTFF